MRSCLSLLFVFFSIFNFSYGQSVTVKGLVTDEANKPIEGVNITVKGTKTGTATSNDGTFSLKVASRANLTLVATHSGFVTKEMSGAGTEDLNFQLTPSVATMSDVVVTTALGLSRKAKGLSYATQSVDPNRMSEARELNIANALTGKVAGIQITTTGQPGSSTRVILRGDNTLSPDGNSQPLWVVDGIPIANGSGESSGDGKASLDVGNGIADLNPDDIESIEVLKGANGAALYGSRAANGAILITTKKARAGDGLGVSVGENFVINSITEFPQYQNVYGEGSGARLVTNAANIIPGTGAVNMGLNAMSWGAPLLGQPYRTYDGQDHGYTPQPQNVQDLYSNSFTNVTSVAVSKADANGSFRASYTFTRSNDVMAKQNIGNRHNFNLYGTRRLSKAVSIDARVLYTYQDWKNRTARDPANNNSSPMAAYLYLPRSIDPDAIKVYKDGAGDAIRYGVQQDGFDNIFWNLNENENEDQRHRIIGGITANIDIAKGLRFKGQVSGDITNFNEYQYREKGGRATADGFYANEMRDNRIWTYEGLLTYNKAFAKNFTLNATLGSNLTNIRNMGRSAQINRLLVHDMPSINNTGGVQSANEFYENLIYQSVFGAATIGFKDFLFMDVTGRNDWSSTLPKDNRSFFYPSIGGSFVFTDLLKSIKFLNFGKIRASYAKVGNSAPFGRLVNTYSLGGIYMGSPYQNYTATLNNASLKPEQIVSKEIGMDLGFWDNRVRLNATFYKSNSTDQILTAQTPTETGFVNRIVNAGEMENRGVELSGSIEAVRAKDFSWTVSGNWSTNRNRVVALVPGVNRLNMAGNLGATTNAVVGQPFGVLMGTIPYRIGDTVLLSNRTNGRVLNEADQILGSPRPEWLGSITNSFSYKNFGLSFMLTAKWGGNIYCASMGRAGFYGNSLASLDGREAFFFSSFVLGESADERMNLGQTVGTVRTRYQDSTRTKGKQWYPITYFPLQVNGQNVIDPKTGRYVPGDRSLGWFDPQGMAADNITANSSLLVYDATSVRLTEVVLSYNIPTKIFGKKGVVKSAKVSAVGRNLWILFKNVPQGIDPEAALNSTTSAYGIEAGGSFPTASYGVDLRISF